MPRKAFMADLARARDGVSIAGISDVQSGDDDGMFTFLCLADGQELRLSAMVPDVSDYPASHDYMLFAPDHAPAAVARNMSTIQGEAFSKPIHQLLELVSRKLESTDSDGDQQMLDSQEFDVLEAEDSDDEDDADAYWPGDDLVQKPFAPALSHSGRADGSMKPSSVFRARIRSDLTTAKSNGFKVGHHGGLMDGLSCYVSLSCRISKLGISEEAMQAWQLVRSEYLIVILSYPNGYKTMDHLNSYDMAMANRNFEVRVGISNTYKPTMQEAVRAFTVLSKEEEKRRDEASQTESQITADQLGFRNAFISQPLNDLLKERFPQLLKYRYNGMPWTGAEAFYNGHIGTPIHSDLGFADLYMAPEEVNTAYPALVTADHIQESSNQQHSLPLVSMQFVLRHFVRCTEFCLVCFAELPQDLQAIKPYVCDKPLCLYQYMSLGFGPSIEHEILSQPKVVDLLISFCYLSARVGKLKDFPSGLSLMVPPSASYGTDYTNLQQQAHNAWGGLPIPNPPSMSVSGGPLPAAGDQETATSVQIRYNAATREILFENKNFKCPLRNGDWIVIRKLEDPTKALHCRITDTSLYPTVQVAEPIVPAIFQQLTASQPYSSPQQPAKSKNAAPVIATAPMNEFRSASYYTYDHNFDELPDFNKREAIFALLDILPSVEDMRQYLHRKAQSPLGSWVDRMPPAALGLLRWIIASNRACIMQVEEEDAISRKGQDRLFGMQGWVQFRFAMGAPDKERRFVQAVRETTDRLKLKFSTLFAWHGSPLHNWHSIIREGLHFNDTAHGRAYGHGVYHSLECNTSMSYSNIHGAFASSVWPMSELKVSQALALNEIVNAPTEYVSRTPHLVVAQLDWIQTRYLFVKTGNDYSHSFSTSTIGSKETKPFDPIEQDSAYTPRGVGGNLIIPKAAISASRRQKSGSIANATNNKRQKTLGSNVYNPIELDADDDDGASVATLEEDLEIFRDEDGLVSRPGIADTGLPTPNSFKGKSAASSFISKFLGPKTSKKPATPPKPLTDYVPGTLDYSVLPMLQQPIWATPAATRQLMKDFKELVKVQAKEPPHELGWHIDEDKVENMYQWIVEMHSFDSTIPLAKDMKDKKCKSIVLELRFGKDYPFSPPFVRVIRPRFLAFQAGGGGHVTAGGALCMQLLTNDGWTAVSSIESVLLQVRMAMSSLDPKPARLEGTRVSGHDDYGVGEAVEAYIRACNAHGWTVPIGFREMAYGGQESAAPY